MEEKYEKSREIYRKMYDQESEDIKRTIKGLEAYKRIIENEEEGCYKAAEIVRNVDPSKTQEKYRKLFKKD